RLRQLSGMRPSRFAAAARRSAAQQEGTGSKRRRRRQRAHRDKPAREGTHGRGVQRRGEGLCGRAPGARTLKGREPVPNRVGSAVMAEPERKPERRTRQRAANRAAILDAARRVSSKTDLGEIALRAVAAEAGYAPASIYEYFRNRAELVLALAADDLGQITRALKELPVGENSIAAASRIALDLVRVSGALAASSSTFEDELPPEAERLFN